LGQAQSGHIAAVGYDLYCQLVTEAVAEMKGEAIPVLVPELKLDVPTQAFLPVCYVSEEELRHRRRPSRQDGADFAQGQRRDAAAAQHQLELTRCHDE